MFCNIYLNKEQTIATRGWGQKTREDADRAAVDTPRGKFYILAYRIKVTLK